DDTLTVNGGSNMLLGGDGNDTINASGGINIVDGGAGTDTLNLSRADLTTAATVTTLADGSSYAFTLADGTSVSNVELLNLTTGSGDDRVTFTSSAIPGLQSWDGGTGNDTAVVDFSAVSSDVSSGISPNGGVYQGRYVIGSEGNDFFGYVHAVTL